MAGGALDEDEKMSFTLKSNSESVGDVTSALAVSLMFAELEANSLRRARGQEGSPPSSSGN